MTLTAQQYAELASDVYKKPDEKGENSRNVNIGGVPYKRLEYIDTPAGYQGIIYQRADTGEIVVAHRGTEPKRGHVRCGGHVRTRSACCSDSPKTSTIESLLGLLRFDCSPIACRLKDTYGRNWAAAPERGH